MQYYEYSFYIFLHQLDLDRFIFIFRLHSIISKINFKFKYFWHVQFNDTCFFNSRNNHENVSLATVAPIMMTPHFNKSSHCLTFWKLFLWKILEIQVTLLPVSISAFVFMSLRFEFTVIYSSYFWSTVLWSFSECSLHVSKGRSWWKEIFRLLIFFYCITL